MGGVGGSALQEATAGTWGGLDLLRMLAYSGLPDPAPVSFPHCCLGSCMPPPTPHWLSRDFCLSAPWFWSLEKPKHNNEAGHSG